MYILLILLLIIVLFILLLAIFPINIAVGVNSYEIFEYNLIFSWAKSLVKGNIKNNDGCKILNLYLFNKKILDRPLKNVNGGMNHNINLIRRIKPDYIVMETSYGFNDPSITGMIYGFISFISQYLNIDELYHNADFMAEDSFFNIKGLIKVNALSAIIQYFYSSNKLYSKKTKGGYEYE
ncbi:DUF2953 domain-containing protein [uncultured Clostridium sp.]|uniref:DUF2953 domain-containing protein n=1 Tax=uncultured Clostridium sp. TaxID=59620 RepID=UPI0028E93F1D|nr:DUF2953 domain-containing protein [uncultured Clostridium sp.]